MEGKSRDFLQLLPAKRKAQYIADTVLNYFESLDISINGWHGQSYDNAPNMSGKYSGQEIRIKEKCEFPILPHVSHIH